MNKPKRRSDDHERKSRTLLLRTDLYGHFEGVVFGKGHSISSATEKVWAYLLKDKTLLTRILKP